MSSSGSEAGLPTLIVSTIDTSVERALSYAFGPDDDARRGRAVLAAVEERAELERLSQRVQIRVVVHEHRRLAAQLQVDALYRLCRCRGDLPARCRVARQATPCPRPDG